MCKLFIRPRPLVGLLSFFMNLRVDTQLCYSIAEVVTERRHVLNWGQRKRASTYLSERIDHFFKVDQVLPADQGQWCASCMSNEERVLCYMNARLACTSLA